MNGDFETGIKLYRAKRYRKALDELLSLSLEPGDNPDLAYYIGLCYAKLEQYDEALLYLEQVVTTHTNIILIYQCRMVLGYIYTVTNRYRLAEFEFKRLLDEGYKSTQVYSAYSYVAYCLGQKEKSLAFLEEALALEPENPNALNSMGYIMAEEEINLQKAVTYCKEALQLKPDHPAYLDSAGWACFKMGKLKEAHAYLKRAYALSGGDSTISSHLREVIKKKEAGSD